ncbi:hypothetical protein BC835DRAFT_1308349 [Cytidiella melzeri]|nr:hypothetical protein BC835DRAFT_1308349 [Cytidiella melzeri]
MRPHAFCTDTPSLTLLSYWCRADMGAVNNLCMYALSARSYPLPTFASIMYAVNDTTLAISKKPALHAPGGTQVTAQHDVPFQDDDVRARMTTALDNHLHGHPDMTALYEPKLAVEGELPKPCFVLGNTLKLIDNNLAPPSCTSSSSLIILDDNMRTLKKKQTRGTGLQGSWRRRVPRNVWIASGSLPDIFVPLAPW